jgi:hypothetical protein
VDPDIGMFPILNEAAEHMENSREWAYLSRSMKRLAFRAQVTGTSGAWVLSTQTITKPSGFTTYTFVPGDEVTMTDTTSGAERGTYKIVSSTANTVVVEGALIVDDTVDFTLNTSRIALPDDFGRIVRVFGVNGFTRDTFSTSASELMRVDTLALTQNNFVTGYALEWNSANDKKQPVATLKIWPEPQSQEYDALAAVYLRNWPAITSDDDELPLPVYMHTLYLQYVRAFAAGYDLGSSIPERVAAQATAVAAIDGSAMFQTAARRDAANQSLLRRPQNRAIRPVSRVRGLGPLSNTRDDQLFST